jgi:hypothetical protein
MPGGASTRFRAMATEERSIIAFEHYREAQQRFEYFIVGVVVALCAYVGQTLAPEPLGLSPYTLEVLSVALLIVSAVVSFKRLESMALGALVNHEMLHFREKRGEFRKGLEAGGFVDAISGYAWPRERLIEEIRKLDVLIPARTDQLKELQKKQLRLYRWRN